MNLSQQDQLLHNGMLNDLSTLECSLLFHHHSLDTQNRTNIIISMIHSKTTIFTKEARNELCARLLKRLLSYL